MRVSLSKDSEAPGEILRSTGIGWTTLTVSSLTAVLKWAGSLKKHLQLIETLPSIFTVTQSLTTDADHPSILNSISLIEIGN
jgi:hypothetical protein